MATAWLFKHFKIELSLKKCSGKCLQLQIDLSRYRTQESQKQFTLKKDGETCLPRWLQERQDGNCLAI